MISKINLNVNSFKFYFLRNESDAVNCAIIGRTRALPMRPCFVNTVLVSRMASEFHICRPERVQIKESQVVRRPKRKAEPKAGSPKDGESWRVAYDEY